MQMSEDRLIGGFAVAPAGRALAPRRQVVDRPHGPEIETAGAGLPGAPAGGRNNGYRSRPAG